MPGPGGRCGAGAVTAEHFMGPLVLMPHRVTTPVCTLRPFTAKRDRRGRRSGEGATHGYLQTEASPSHGGCRRGLGARDGAAGLRPGREEEAEAPPVEPLRPRLRQVVQRLLQ